MATSGLSLPAHTPPPPCTLEGGDLVWDVNRILAVCCRGRGFHYLVDWVGCGPEDRTWVPRSYLADPALLEEFYRANPSAIGRSSGVSVGRGVLLRELRQEPWPRPFPHLHALLNVQANVLSSSDQSHAIVINHSLPTRAHQIRHSAQKRSSHSSSNTRSIIHGVIYYRTANFFRRVHLLVELTAFCFSPFLHSAISSRDPS